MWSWLDKRWEDVRRAYRAVVDWYQATPIYHRIGFLSVVGGGEATSFESLVGEYEEGKTRYAFLSFLNRQIRQWLCGQTAKYAEDTLSGGTDSSEDSTTNEAASANDDNDQKCRDQKDRREILLRPTYEDADDRRFIRQVLLLFNVLETEKVGQRFPFDRYRTIPDRDWTLEHIHAQNEDDVDTSEKATKYLNELERHVRLIRGKGISDESLPTESEFGDLKRLLEDAGSRVGQVQVKTALELFKEFVDKHADKGDLFGLHSIDNLALLSGSDNKKLSNSFFPEKRTKVLDLWRNTDGGNRGDHFIPPATVSVFQKAYTATSVDRMREESGDGGELGGIDLTLWTKHDRDAYLTRIIEVLDDYLPRKSDHDAAPGVDAGQRSEKEGRRK